jgi:hypothetical protein
VAHTVYRSIVVAALAVSVAAAHEPTLDRRAIADAIAIGQSRIEQTHTRFHQAYRIAVNRPPVDYLDVVTPFRRVVLAAEATARVGRGPCGDRAAYAAVGDGSPIDIAAELTFHPLNVLVTVPSYEMALVAAGQAAIRPLDIERRPRSASRCRPLHPPV